MITWPADSRGIVTALATLFVACCMAAGQAADPALTDSDPKLGKQIGRIQRGEDTILLYEHGDIVVSRQGAMPVTNSIPGTAATPEPLASASGPAPGPAAVPPPVVTRPSPKPEPGVASTTPAPAVIRVTAPTTKREPTLPPHAPEPDPIPHAPEPASVATPAADPTPPGDTPDAIAGLITRLSNPDKSVRREAQQALVAIGGSRVIAPVMTLLSTADAPAHGHAAAAHILGELAATNAVALLTEKLLAEGFGARLETVEALGKIGEPAAAPALIKAVKLADYSPKLRVTIYRALGEVDNKTAIRPLMVWLRQEQDSYGQIEAAAALDRLTGQAFGNNNAQRMAWLKAQHPEWLEGAPDTEVDRRYVSIMRMTLAGLLVGAGLVILLITR